MTSLPMSREARAEQLAADAGQWLSVRSRGGEVLHGIPSQRVPGRYWLTDGHACTCPDFAHNGLSRQRLGQAGAHVQCKHILAVQLVERARQPASDTLDGLEQMARDRTGLDRILGTRPPLYAIDQRGRYTSGPFTGLPATVREGSA